MRGDRVEFAHRRVRVGFGWFGGGLGHRSRFIPGVRAFLDARDFAGRHASGCLESFRYRHAFRVPDGLRARHGLRAPDEFPHAREFRRVRKLHGARHPW